MHPALGIDYGEARIGIAATDACGILAHPVESIHLQRTEPLERIATLVKERGIRTHVLKKIGEDGSDEIVEAMRQGHIAYVINTRNLNSMNALSDGVKIRRAATENNVTMFTSLDTVRVLLDVLEETTLTISTIDA